MTRIEAGIAPQLNPFAPQAHLSGQAAQVESVGTQVQQVLFGRLKPPVLDPAQFPQLAEQLRLLQKYRKKFAVMAGDAEEDYELLLADGGIAMIDADGKIYVGAQFLQRFGETPAIALGVLAHEIGHRPKRWNEYRTRRQLTQAELQMLCRHEEIRADFFAGTALAEMSLPFEPLAELLVTLEDRPHPEYLPAADRARVIAEAHAGRAYRRKARRSLFPDFDRMTSPKGHLGEY